MADIRKLRRMRDVLLTSGRAVTGEQLAADVGLSVRTVYRYMEHLRMMGFNVRAERGVGIMIQGKVR